MSRDPAQAPLERTRAGSPALLVLAVLGVVAGLALLFRFWPA